MARIKVDTVGIEELRQMASGLDHQIREVLDAVSYAQQHIDMETSSSENIMLRMKKLSQRMAEQQDRMNRYSTALGSVNERFLTADRKVANQARDVNYLVDRMRSGAVRHPSKESLKAADLARKAREMLDLFADGKNPPQDILCGHQHGQEEVRKALEKLRGKSGTLPDIMVGKGGISPTVLGTLGVGLLTGGIIGCPAPNQSDIRGVGELSGYISADPVKVTARVEGKYGNAGVSAHVGRSEFSADLKKGKLGGSASAVTVEGDVSTGNDILGAKADAQLDLLSAEAKASSNFSTTEEGVNAYIQGSAIVSAVKGKASSTLKLGPLEIKLKAKGYLGAAGVEGKMGIENDKLVLEGGVALGAGGSVGLEIGFNPDGIKAGIDYAKQKADQFVDFITFWD